MITLVFDVAGRVVLVVSGSLTKERRGYLAKRLNDDPNGEDLCPIGEVTFQEVEPFVGDLDDLVEQLAIGDGGINGGR